MWRIFFILNQCYNTAGVTQNKRTLEMGIPNIEFALCYSRDARLFITLIAMNPQQIKFAVYARKSSEPEDRQALSIEQQIEEVEKIAKQRNVYFNPKRDIYFEAKSARIPGKREKFNELIEAIKGGKYKGIICWHINRLSRNPLEGGIVQQLIIEDKISKIITASDEIDSSNCNEIVMSFLFGYSSQTSREIGQNTKRGLRKKIEEGQYPTYAPPFYENYCWRNENHCRNIRPDKDAEYYTKLVNQIITNRLTYKGIMMLLRSWDIKTKKGKEYATSTVQRLLRNPVYCGYIKRGDMQEVKGKWEPLITREKWLVLQEVLDDHDKPYQSRWFHPFKKLIKCGKCGSSITAYTKMKESGKKYVYYTCSKSHGPCDNAPITGDNLERELHEYIQQIKIGSDKVQQLIQYILDHLEKELAFEITRTKDAESQLRENSEKLDRLLTLHIEGNLSKVDYLEKRDGILKENEKLESLRGDIKYNRDDVRKSLELFFDGCVNLKILFSNGTLEEKRQIVHNVLENIVLEDRKISSNFKKPYDSLVSIPFDEKTDKWGP